MTKEFWKALLIRVAKTWCQAFIGIVGIDGAGRTLADINWGFALSAATLAAIICLVWNIGIGLPEVQLAKTLYALDNNDGEIDPNYNVVEEEESDE